MQRRRLECKQLFGLIVGSVAVLFNLLLPESLATTLAELKGKITLTLGSLHSLVDVTEQKGKLISGDRNPGWTTFPGQIWTVRSLLLSSTPVGIGSII
jgi:hypothetical protein